MTINGINQLKVGHENSGDKKNKNFKNGCL